LAADCQLQHAIFGSRLPLPAVIVPSERRMLFRPVFRSRIAGLQRSAHARGSGHGETSPTEGLPRSSVPSACRPGLQLLSRPHRAASSVRIVPVTVLVLLLSACSSNSGHAAASGDAGPESAAVSTTYLEDYNHEIEITCPCRVQQGLYPSEAECLRAQVLSQDTVTCLSVQFQAEDSTELRASLRCLAEASRSRGDCIAASACDMARLNACYDAAMQCPVPDPQLLTRVFNACPDSILLAR
jgi:hypothetical protein